MDDLQSRDALLETMHSLRNEIKHLIAEAEEKHDPEARPNDSWSFKDILAHLTSWRLTTAARLEAGLRGEEPSMPWPSPLDEENDLDEINRWFFETNRDKPLAEIALESRETFERAERAIAGMPERDLLEPGRFPWIYGFALGPAVVAGTRDHFREHEPEMRALLAQDDRRAAQLSDLKMSG
jgi:hypothetical protein